MTERINIHKTRGTGQAYSGNDYYLTVLDQCYALALRSTLRVC